MLKKFEKQLLLMDLLLKLIAAPPVILMIRLSLFLTCPGALSSRILSQIIDAGSILSGIILEIASVCALGF